MEESLNTHDFEDDDIIKEINLNPSGVKTPKMETPHPKISKLQGNILGQSGESISSSTIEVRKHPGKSIFILKTLIFY